MKQDKMKNKFYCRRLTPVREMNPDEPCKVNRAEDTEQDDEGIIDVGRTEQHHEAGPSGTIRAAVSPPTSTADSRTADSPRAPKGGVATFRHGQASLSETTTVVNDDDGDSVDDSVPIPVNLEVLKLVQSGRGHKRSKYVAPWQQSKRPATE